MSKKISVKVKCQNEIKQFVCKHSELEQEISSYFKINLKDFSVSVIDKGERKPITFHDIKDSMKIEIASPITGQQTTQNTDASNEMAKNIVSKLRLNTPFDAQERRAVLEALQTHGIKLFKKRKIETADAADTCTETDDKSECFNKKVQVCLAKKDSFAQTDPLLKATVVYDGMDKDNDEDRQLRLQRLWVQKDVSRDLINHLMDKTYIRRRIFIHEGPSVSEIIKEYPALFCLEQIKKEMERLFYPGKTQEFFKNINKYTKHILRYKDSKTYDTFKKIEKACSRVKTLKQKAYIENMGSTFVLSKLLNENCEFIHLSDKPISDRMEEYHFPYINAERYKLKEIMTEEVHYNIIVENEHLCETTDFCEAIFCYLASFFLFLINYPQNCRNTLTAFEKLYLVANETREIDEYTGQVIEFYKNKANSDKGAK